jgi:hypothetical protein
LEEKDDKKEERITWLEDQLKIYTRGYSKALIFINANVTGKEIPNFLETDPWTGPPDKTKPLAK